MEKTSYFLESVLCSSVNVHNLFTETNLSNKKYICSSPLEFQGNLSRAKSLIVHFSSLAKWTSNLRSETKNPVYQFETYNSRLTLNISDSLFSASTALLSDAYLMLRCSFRRCKVRSGDRNDVISVWIVLGTSVYPVSRRRWAIVM